MPSEFDVESFIISNFRSVWALDLVRILLADAEQGFSSDELVNRLRASDAVAQQSVGALTSAGLVIVENDRIRLHIERSLLFLIRLAAFLVIIFALWRLNRQRRMEN